MSLLRCPLTPRLAPRALLALLLWGCSDPATTYPPSPTDSDASEATFLAAYYGLDALPPLVAALCDANSVGEDGLPVTLSVQLDGSTVTPEAFVVETDAGEPVTPVCATLRPADEPLELRTVLLAGPFGTPDAQPRAVEVVGDVEDLDGNTLLGLRTEALTALEQGPSVVLAERYAPDTCGLEDECPDGTSQVVQLVWEGGVSGPAGGPLGEAQRLAVSVSLEDGSTVTPVALADDDPDNFVLACIEEASPATSVTVDAGVFHDPGDDPNPETSAHVVER